MNKLLRVKMAMSNIAVRLRSIAFNAAFFGWTAFLCFALLWALILPKRGLFFFIHMWLRHLEFFERHIAGITYEVKGLKNVPKGPCIIAAKHQSAWETCKMHLMFYDPAIVLKKELLSLPVWGWYAARAGMIPIDRGGRSKAVSGMLEAARQAVAERRKIVIFPQGTRTAVGEKRPYKSGVAALYQDLNVPVVPMALNSGLFWPRNSFLKRPGRITVEFLAPIPPGLQRDEMMKRLQSELEDASGKLAGLSDATS